MQRLGIHNGWHRKFLQRQLDIRVTDYAGLDQERLVAHLAFDAQIESAVSAYANEDSDQDLGTVSLRLQVLGRTKLRRGLSDLYANRETACLDAVYAGAWQFFLSRLLWGGYWRATRGLPPRGYLFTLMEFTENYSRAQSLGWHAQADKLHELVFGLQPVSPLWQAETFDPRWEKSREPWGRFTLALCSEFYGHELPPMPAHPYDSPAFDALLACWRDPDPSVLAEPLLAVCDWHTHECMYSRSDRPSKNVDFLDDTLMGWPVEVHTVFRLRERLGLALPPMPEHPLMHTTPMGPYRPPQPVPVDDLMQRFIERGCKEVPGLRALLGAALPG